MKTYIQTGNEPDHPSSNDHDDIAFEASAVVR